MNPERISYAQNREDIILSGFFTGVKKGFYVDVGAYDPVRESVTKYFYDRGWHGINIDPIPLYYEKLRKARPRDTNLHLGIGSEKGTTTLHYYPDGDGLSTLSKEMANQNKKRHLSLTAEEQVLEVQVLPLREVLAKYAKSETIHFMKIDVEGYENEVIKGNDWTKYRPQVLCIEANHIFNEWESFLLDQKYQKVFFDGLNNYYVADEVSEKGKNFSYVRTILELQPVNYMVNDEIIGYQEEVARLKRENDKLNILIKSDAERIVELEEEIGRPRSLKEAIKIFAASTHRTNVRLIEKLKPIAKTGNISRAQKDPQKLLASIQIYDKENEELANAAFNPRMIPYKIVNGLYGLLILFVKKLEKIVRTMLHNYRNRK